LQHALAKRQLCVVMARLNLNPETVSASIAGARADYRASDYFFQRTQSAATRDAEWESRIKPLKPWNEILTLGLLGAAGVATALAVFA
jgi:hypothetical protein